MIQVTKCGDLWINWPGEIKRFHNGKQKKKHAGIAKQRTSSTASHTHNAIKITLVG